MYIFSQDLLCVIIRTLGQEGWDCSVGLKSLWKATGRVVSVRATPTLSVRGHPLTS